jgi:GNAT superfamily N-acetyltransferase
MTLSITIRKMVKNDIYLIYNGLYDHNVSKPREYVEQCWQENLKDLRKTFLAVYDGNFVGWGHLIFNPDYPFFAENDIPEIQNFDVIPSYRKLGIGSQLIDSIEQFAFERYDAVGIGFGLYADYGTAQRMYVKRGYIPDGRGLMYNNLPVEPGSQVSVDDDLVLFLTKKKSK